MKQHSLSSAVFPKRRPAGLITAIGLFACIAGMNARALAEDKPAAAEREIVDEDEQLDQALRKFGYVSGQACQLQEGEKRAEFEKKALDVANRILRLFGSDHAFYFAAAFGAGLVADIKDADRDKILEEHAKMVAQLKSLSEGK
jgi:hypothetical protein